MPQLPTCSPGTPKQKAVRDDSSTHSGSQGHEDQVLDVLPRAEAELSPRRGVGVVLGRHLQSRTAAQLLLERYALDSLEVGSAQDFVFASQNKARDGKSDTAYLVSSLDLYDSLGDGRE